MLSSRYQVFYVVCLLWLICPSLGDEEEKLIQKDTKSGSFLFFAPAALRSIDISVAPLIEALVTRGHHVVVVSPFKNEKLKDFQNYRHLRNENEYKKLLESVMPLLMKDNRMFSRERLNLIINNPFKTKLPQTCLTGLDNVDLQEIIKAKLEGKATAMSLDVIVIVGPVNVCGYPLTQIFEEASFVEFSPQGPWNTLDYNMGNPTNPSYIPSFGSPLRGVTFLHRLGNSLLYLFSSYSNDNIFKPYLTIAEKRFGLPSRSFAQYESNVALHLINTHASIHGSNPRLQNTVEVGGIHCEEAKPLPQEMQDFMDSATKGAMLMSFGSTLKSSVMKPEKVDTILQTFRGLAPIKFVWKWDGAAPKDLPTNVLLTTWAPQQDLLGHPNLKVFVTHGGLLSITEAICHNVVLVGSPFSGDQFANVAIVVQNKIGLQLDFNGMTEESLRKTLEEAMNDEDLQNNMEMKHKFLMDQKEKPIDRAVWWMEFLLRHPGAVELRPTSLKLSLIEYLLIDVIVFVLFLLVVLCSAGFCCCRFCCKGLKRCCFKPKKKNE